MVIYNTTLGCLQLLSGGSWNCLNNNSANVPRLTYEQIQALPNPRTGDLAYDLTVNSCGLILAAICVPLTSARTMLPPE